MIVAVFFIVAILVSVSVFAFSFRRLLIYILEYLKR
jgi:hypothetical protein